jgi:hypothetical protein
VQHLFAEYTAPRGGGKEPISLDAERRRRRRRWPAPGAPDVPVPACHVCGAPIDDDEGGLYNLDDMRERRECRDHCCPF